MAQTLLAFDPHPADPHTGFGIGWDHAHHGLVPPAGQLLDGNAVRQGWLAGKACFGARTLGASPRARRWLQLRLHAWQRGICFELGQVTPHYLGQIEAVLCPITRQRLCAAEASVDRVCDQAGYAAGNLAMVSHEARRAKRGIGWEQALAHARQAEGEAGGRVGGLDGAAWSRLAVLLSFVTPLAHAQAACLPLLLTPPNRLRLLNPVQGLQALVTRALGLCDGPRCLRELAAALPHEASRLHFNLFLNALLPRLIEARRSGDAWVLRHALEDAWRDARVNRCWQRFALPLDEARVDKLLQHLAAGNHAGTRLMLHERAAATEGWALDTGGRALAAGPWRAPRPLPPNPAPPRQARIGASLPRTADGHLPA